MVNFIFELPLFYEKFNFLLTKVIYYNKLKSIFEPWIHKLFHR